MKSVAKLSNVSKVCWFQCILYIYTNHKGLRSPLLSPGAALPFSSMGFWSLHSLEGPGKRKSPGGGHVQGTPGDVQGDEEWESSPSPGC